MFSPYRLLAKTLRLNECLKLYLEYERCLIKRERGKCRILFLESCLQADIIPKFLKFRIPSNGCFEPTVVHNFQRRLLKQELSKAKETVLQHDTSLDAKRSALQQSILETLIPSVVAYTRMAVHSTRKEVTTMQQKKLDNLSREQ